VFEASVESALKERERAAKRAATWTWVEAFLWGPSDWVRQKFKKYLFSNINFSFRDEILSGQSS